MRKGGKCKDEDPVDMWHKHKRAKEFTIVKGVVWLKT